MSLSNCPPDFNNNCTNYIYKCNLCAAGSGHPNGPLYYKPINSDAPPRLTHPVATEKSNNQKEVTKAKKNSFTYKQKSKQVKGGFKAEKTIANNIAKQTLKSGSLLQDGDITLFNGDLNLDSKVRYNRAGFGITKQEYQKGKSSKVDGWVITNKQDSNEDSVVILTMDSFTQLLAYKQQLEQNL